MRSLDDLPALVSRQTLRSLASGDLQPTATELHTIEDGGIRFAVRVNQGFDRKKRSKTEQERTGLDPFEPPYDDDLFVVDASDTHVVLLNKYPVVQDHLVVVTREFEPQQSLLTGPDFEGLLACMLRLGGLGFYNAGAVAGASQSHKHLQWVPLTDSGLLTEELLTAADRSFACASAAIDPGAQWVVRYRELVKKLGLAAGDPYNLLLTSDAMFVIPRTRNGFEGFSVNALGYAGSFLVRNREDLERLQEIGPRRVLAGAARPS